MYYSNLFFIFSIIGFFYEKILALFKNNSKSALLYGPWIPVYGFAVLIMVFTNNFLKKINFKNKWQEKLLFFLIVTITMTLLELGAGYLIEWIFGEVFWNYEHLWFNFGKYIALEVSLVWGIIALFVNYYVIPRIKNYVKKIPSIFTVVLIVMFIVDFILTIITKI